MVRRWFALALLVAAACGREEIAVKPAAANDDYKHTELVKAVDKFVAAGRTADAFGELAATVSTLRPYMDRAVGKEAELKLITLALGPVQGVQNRSMRDKLDTLALTVWPTLLAPPIAADTILQVRDPNAVLLLPKPGEDPDQYVTRLCGEVLKRECKRVVPEMQPYLVEALAIRRGTERARNAVNECLACGNDPGWHQAVLQWEYLDRAANEWVVDIERRADPDNWPVAGAAAEDDPGLPEAELSTRGDLIIGGHSYGPNLQRIDTLSDLRGRGRCHRTSPPSRHDARPSPRRPDRRPEGRRQAGGRHRARAVLSLPPQGLLGCRWLRHAGKPAADRLAPALAPRHRRDGRSRHRRADRLRPATLVVRVLLLIEYERKRDEAIELLKLSRVGLVLMAIFLLAGDDIGVIAIPVTAGFTLGFLTVGAWKYQIAARVIRELKQPAPARLLKG